MAHMSQEKKKLLAPKIKAALAEYGIKATIGVKNHSTLVLNITEGAIDFIGNYNAFNSDRSKNLYAPDRFEPAKDYIQVNHYHYDKHFDDKAALFLGTVLGAMNEGNHDHSDIQTDYFNVGWWVSINIGRWNKPYKFNPALEPKK